MRSRMTLVNRHTAVEELRPDPRDAVHRVSQVVDRGTMIGLGPPDDSGVYTACGQVDGGNVVVYCTDATRMGGAVGARGCMRITEAIELAVGVGCPVIGIWHSGGARLAEGVESLDGLGRV